VAAKRTHGRPGRKPKLSGDAALMDKLVKLRKRSLLFDAQIGLRCGLHPDTIRHWLKLGLQKDAHEPYKTFAQRYSDAKLHVEEQQLKRGAERGKDGAGNRWWLEKSIPKRYGVAVPASGPPQAIEIEDLLKEIAEQPRTLDELLADPPLELQEAMVRNAAAIRSFLDAAVPLLAPENGNAAGRLVAENGGANRHVIVEGGDERV
jgi:hypothetical protein